MLEAGNLYWVRPPWYASLDRGSDLQRVIVLQLRTAYVDSLASRTSFGESFFHFSLHAESSRIKEEQQDKRMELEYQDWARLQGRGPHTGGPKDRLVGWRTW